MSCFKNPRFAKELAYRTMVNYYLLRDYPFKNNTEFSPELQRLIGKMKEENFDITMKYEVTLLLNSLVGLLIIPQQEYYKESENSTDFWKLPTLKKCTEDKSYINTYEENKDSPANVIRHMKNAVSHKRLMIIPETANNKDITHIRFSDRAPGGCRFELRIGVEQLESVLMEIAEYLIGFKP
jgi:hypothetical protein